MATIEPYDSKFKALVEKKAKMRTALREEFIKQMYNPHRHATGEGGTVFDPALQRYMTMTNNRHQYFRPSPKTSILGFLLVAGPIIGICHYMVKSKKEEEQRLRQGLVPYKDRWGKFF